MPPLQRALQHGRGSGKVRHIEVNQLWVQEKVAQGIIKIIKISTDVNVADSLTKYLSAEGISKHMAFTNQWIEKRQTPSHA